MLNRKPPYLGVAYYPEDWDESEIDRDIEKMQRIGVDTVRIAEFAWHRMEPHPGEFDFSFFHRVVDKMHAAHINVVLGTPTATPPQYSPCCRRPYYYRSLPLVPLRRKPQKFNQT